MYLLTYLLTYLPARYVADTLRRSRHDVCLNVMPLFHIHGLVANVGVSLLSRGAVVCSSFQVRLRLRLRLRLRVSRLLIVPGR